MRKFLFLGLAVFALSLASCKKCKTCDTSTTVSETGSEDIVVKTSKEYCKDEYDNAPAETDVTTQDGDTYTHVVVKCTEK